MSSQARLLKTILPIGLLVLAALSAAAMIALKPDVETQAPEIRPPLVRVTQVEIRDVRLSVESQGTVSPRTQSQLVPEVAGRVTWVSPHFAEGEFFEEGEVLLKIDPHDYRLAVTRLEAEVARARLRLAQEQAEAEVARREWADLGEGEASPLTLREPQVQDAQAALKAAEANLATTERNLERTEIRAPYAGRLRRKSVDVGQFVTVGSPVATLYAVDFAEIRLPLPDDDLAFLELSLDYRGDAARQRGPSVTLRAEFAGHTHEWQGEIVRTEGEIDAASRMVHAVARVANPYGRGEHPGRPPLAVGMYVEAEIEGRTARNVAVLPRLALRGRAQVLVVTGDDRLEFRDVELLRKSREHIIVKSGLERGERVCISPLEAVTDGMRVRTTPEGQAPDRGATS